MPAQDGQKGRPALQPASVTVLANGETVLNATLRILKDA